jgi:hypothetical protein
MLLLHVPIVVEDDADELVVRISAHTSLSTPGHAFELVKAQTVEVSRASQAGFRNTGCSGCNIFTTSV